MTGHARASSSEQLQMAAHLREQARKVALDGRESREGGARGGAQERGTSAHWDHIVLGEKIRVAALLEVVAQGLVGPLRLVGWIEHLARVLAEADDLVPHSQEARRGCTAGLRKHAGEAIEGSPLDRRSGERKRHVARLGVDSERTQEAHQVRVGGEVANLEAEVNRPDLLGVDRESMPTTGGLRFEENDVFALLVEEEGAREAGDPRTDHGDALARLRRHRTKMPHGRTVGNLRERSSLDLDVAS